VSMTQKLRSFRWSDYGNAQALALIFGSNLRYCSETKDWFRWNGEVWEACHAGDINQMAIEASHRQKQAWESLQVGDEGFALRESAIKYYGNVENRNKFVSCALTAADLPELRVRYTDFDADIWKLGLLNGELDLRTGQFSPPRKESYITKRADVRFDATADCPRWRKFISEVFCDDAEMIEAVQRMFGYCLTGSVEEQVMFMCVGDGSNGKSTMFNVIRRVMGDYAKLTPFATFNASSRSEQSNDLASLAGSRYVTISESDEDSYLAEAKLKAVTGSDPITCRFLRKEFFSYIPQFKIWMGTNQLPGIRGMNHGNFRRQIILHFNATFDKDKRINGLENILFGEAAGILNWMVEGLMRWHKVKFTSHLPKSILDARQAYRSEMDMVGKWMEECLDIDDGVRVPIKTTELYANYREYVAQYNHRPKGNRIWTQELRSKGHVSRKTNGYYVFDRIAIRPYGAVYVDKKDWPEAIEIKETK